MIRLLWFCVKSVIDRKGRVEAAIAETREAEQKPKDTEEITNANDVYFDWFGSRKEAEAYIAVAKNA